MNKAYKFRIYPNAEQRIMFAKMFGCVRFIYNRMLADKFAKKKLITPAKYKEEFEWLREVDSLALCNAQMNLRITRKMLNTSENRASRARRIVKVIRQTIRKGR